MDFSRQISNGLIPLLIVFALGSCGGYSETPDATDPVDNAVTALTGQPALPIDDYIDPAVIAAEREASDAPRRLSGHECMARGELTTADCTTGTITFDPVGTNGAWALYRFDNLLAADLPLVVQVDFSGTPGRECYLGLADYETGSWCWYPWRGDELYLTSEGAGTRNPISAGGRLYAAIYVVGSGPVTMQSIELAEYPSGAAGRGEWCMPGGNSRHTHCVSVNGPAVPEVKWVRTGLSGREKECGPVFGADGTLFVFDADSELSSGGLYALYPDGSEKWCLPLELEDLGVALSPDGMLYTTEESCDLLAFNPDGTRAWTFETDAPTYASPVIAVDGTLYYTNDAYNLFAVNPDGTEKWRFNGPESFGAPAVSPEGTVLVCCTYGALFAVNPDGTQRWRYETRGRMYGSPTVCPDGTVLACCEDRLVAVNACGTLRWEFQTGDRLQADPAVGGDGRIRVGSTDGKMYCLSATGKLLWEYAAGGGISVAGVLDGTGTVYFAGNDGMIQAVGGDGETLWTWGPLEHPEVPENPCHADTDLSIGPDGTLYFFDNAGRLFALGQDGS